MKIKLFFLGLFVSSITYSQSIQEYYNFRFPNDTIADEIKSGDIAIYSFGFPHPYSKPEKIHYKEKSTYIYQNNILKDSIDEEKKGSFSIYERAIVRTPSKLYLVRPHEIKNPLTLQEEYREELVTIDKKKAKVIDEFLLPDSISLLHKGSENYFLYTGQNYQRLYTFSPQSKTSTLLYDFTNQLDKYSYHSEEAPSYGVGDFIQLKDKDKLLILATLWDGGIIDVKYFILDLKTLKAEEVTSYFNKLVEVPKEKLKEYPEEEYKYFEFEPKYKTYYNDITDSIAYIQATDVFGRVKGKQKGISDFAIYPQDVFVLNNEYQIIDRVLPRENQNYNSIMIYDKNDQKIYARIQSQTDSASCYFNIAIKYPLEKAFYNIYYNKEITAKELESFDQYELLLLKNFIYAKYNYKFSNPFYEAYYNTFTFYHDFQTWDSAKKKIPRRKKVDKYFTEADKKNLALILKKIDNK